MVGFRLLISTEVLDIVARLPRKDALALRAMLRAIGADPYGQSAAVSYDEVGRRLEIAIAGDYALMFWIDEADRHVKVLDVHAVDR